jgi:CDP-glycerol glycerophosphotransferase (TagB/SpsB family)
MPTFKQSPNKNYSEEYLKNETGLALFNTKKDLIKIDDFLEEAGVEIYLKLHRLQAELEIFEWIYKNLKNLKIIGKYEGDFYGHLKEYDALITDYSSISTDWLLTDKPAGFIFTDLKDYQASRGEFCCDPIEYSAGHHIYNMLQFQAFVIDVLEDRDIYKPQREFVKKAFHKFPDNRSAQRIAEFLGV